ncbi:hypothetical protein DL95DRAFT_424507 [Leptodontidium sp. 2 PMI_412]|nr:hypothetical protein DL95DRAFT_424507 [Leptodontidium sp. 2 PMI_412]
MEVVEHAQRFAEIDGDYQFSDTVVIYRSRKGIYHGTSKSRWMTAPRDIMSSELELSNTVLIPTAAYCPLFEHSKHTRYDLPIQSPVEADVHCYFMKKPSLLSYDPASPTDISERVLREIETCEVLKRNPHPNIARYLGCHVQDGRIIAICYDRYSDTLMHMVNPGSLNKRALAYSGPDQKLLEDCLNGVEEGLRHLHSLDTRALVIIDFDSCRPAGESLLGVGRTFGWYDVSVETSVPRNDLDALDEIREWLRDGGGSRKTFKFED